MTHKKKLIEVALPLPEINDASAYDKMPGIGPHPKGIHHWWARLPLPTARAILFASVVDDPSENAAGLLADPGKRRAAEKVLKPQRKAWELRKKDFDKARAVGMSIPDPGPEPKLEVIVADQERERLFGIIRRMMQKKLHEHPEVYAEARAEMLKHCDGRLPPLLDPFAGGGSIPLEASRLGFEAHAGDLNPVAVLLNKCNLELAPRCANHPPVNPDRRGEIGGAHAWQGTRGLAADVRYYGQRIREQAQKTLGHLYPSVAVVQEKDGSYRHATPDEIKSPKSKVQHLNVIAWLWARTVASDNAAARGTHVPLISTYWLSSAKGKLAWLTPVVDKARRTYRFDVCTGEPPDRNAVKVGTKLGRGGFKCLLTGTPIPFEHIRREGMDGRLGHRLLAIVVGTKRGRIYLPATPDHERIAVVDAPRGELETELPEEALGFRVQNYGIRKHRQMFTPRQLTALVTLSDLVKENHAQVLEDAQIAGMSGTDAVGYADALTSFLALAADRCADFNNSLCRWKASGQQLMQLFGRQAIPMVWDFAEANFIGEIAICWLTAFEIEADAIEAVMIENATTGKALQVDAATGAKGDTSFVVSTDPPYYDNIGYAVLSDFFYVWLRRTVGHLYPELFSTVLVPKMPELTASPERFDGATEKEKKEKAKTHFESGFRKAFTVLREQLDPRFPLTVYYAFKQEDTEEEETDADDTAAVNGSLDLTTGWETLLEALISSGFQITGTWPVRASQAWRMRAMGANALASYIVLACRPRSEDAGIVSRRDFLAALKKELPEALGHLQQGNIAPVDLAQAAIGPGMAVFSQYGKVVETDGSPMSVRTALSLINQTLDEVLAEQEGEFDADTRWALAWFDQNGFNEGAYGVAETLSTAKNTSVSGMVETGILAAKGGKVRLLKKDELDSKWDPATDKRLTIWEITHQLIRRMDQGETAAAELIQKLGTKAEVARDLSYRLYTICERRKWASEAIAYNSLVLAWGDINRLAQERKPAEPVQGELL
jgi:putative DNA methylase